MLNVGFGSFVNTNDILAIMPYAGSRLLNEVSLRKKSKGGERTMLLDCTRGKVIKSVVICKNGLYIASNISPETLVRRFNNIKEGGRSFED